MFKGDDGAQKNNLLEVTVTSCKSKEDLHDCKLNTELLLLFKSKMSKKGRGGKKKPTKTLLIINLCNLSVLFMIVLYQNKVGDVLCLEQTLVFSRLTNVVLVFILSGLAVSCLPFPDFGIFHLNFPVLLLMKKQN